LCVAGARWDTGTPLVVAQPEHPQSQAFRAIAERVVAENVARPAESAPAIQ
jgi:hypothetical protein